MVRTMIIAVTAFGVAIVGGVVISPSALASRPYKNCTEAHQDGRYNIPQDDPAYSSKLDRDGDGLACEPKP